ncbi:uncharacterized protein [Littorina saxatilis]|uniref:uncharacterized protein n=1 Tax=Littorina saxatilis TaxID=31220 RepID=UPI0038B658F5
MPRTCAVTSCRNSETKLRKWGAEICERHHIAQRSCDCGWPYELRPFPAAKKEHVLREEWIKQMHRKDPASSYKRWEPNNESRVCSLHFIPGGTIPTLDLGHNRKQVKERSLPRRRCNSHNIFQHHTKKEKHVDLEPAATSQPNCDEPAGQTTATPPSSPDAPAGGSPVAQAPASPDATAAQAPAFPDATAAQAPASPDATAAQAPASPDATAAPDTQAASPNCDHNYAYSSVCFANCACKCCDEKDKVIVELKRKLFAVSAALEVLENELCSTQEKVLKNNHIPWTQFVKNNKAVRQNTGFPSKQLLDRVFTSLQSKARRMRYWQGAKRTQNL